MPPSYYCVVCRLLAFNWNSYLTNNGRDFVHRGCKDKLLETEGQRS